MINKNKFIELCEKIAQLERKKKESEGKTELEYFEADINKRKEYLSEFEIIKPTPTIETPLIVHNYPYGFRLRTDIRYYLETTNKGTRLTSQTLNPKTNEWNKPKSSTYNTVAVMVKDKKTGYINHVGLGYYDNVSQNLALLKDVFDILNEQQLNALKEWVKIMYINCFVTCKCETITKENEQRLKEEHEKSQAELKKLYSAIYNITENALKEVA